MLSPFVSALLASLGSLLRSRRSLIFQALALQQVVYLPKLATTSWVIVIFGEMERVGGYRGIIRDDVPCTPYTDH
jgi:hypothetical protein